MVHRVRNALVVALTATLAACSQGASMPGADAPMPQPPMAQQVPMAGPNDAFPPMPQQQPGQQLPSMPPPLDTSRMQPVEIRDSQGMVASQVQIPLGWQAVGGVTLDESTSCASNMVKVGWSTIGPDSLTAVELMPGFNWQVQGMEGPMNPCPAAPFRTVRDFMMATVQETRPGARVLDFQKQPQLEQQAAQAAGGQGMGQVQYDGGRMLIGYQKDGVEMREVLIAVLGLTNAGGSVMGNVGSMYSIRAPEGRLDMDLPMRIAGSMQPNRQWMQMLRQRMMAAMQRYHAGQAQRINDWHNRKMAMINAKGAADRHAIRMRANQDVASIYSAIAANTSATSDAMHRRTMEGVGEYNSYAGTDGSTVQSSIHGGSRVFQDNTNPNAGYSTNDPYHAPTGATELERIP